MKKHIDEIVKSYAEDDYVLDVALYVRVSTASQHTENQIWELKEICSRNRWNIVEIYDETASGVLGANHKNRTELKRLLDDAGRKKFDKVVVWSVDRIGRSMKHLVNVLSQLKDIGCDIYSYKQSIDTSTTMGSSFFHMIGIFAELENNMRAERQRIGIKRALENGAKFGRKTKLDKATISTISDMRKQGQSIRKIAKQVNLGIATVHKVCTIH